MQWIFLLPFVLSHLCGACPSNSKVYTNNEDSVRFKSHANKNSNQTSSLACNIKILVAAAQMIKLKIHNYSSELTTNEQYLKISSCASPSKQLALIPAQLEDEPLYLFYEACIQLDFYSRASQVWFEGDHRAFSNKDALNGPESHICRSSAELQLDSEEGFLTSENWPQPFVNQFSCSWRLEMKRKHAKLFFVQLDTKPGALAACDSNAETVYVKLIDDSGNEETKHAECGKETTGWEVKLTDVEHQQIVIKFSQQSNIAGRQGFAMSYYTYNDYEENHDDDEEKHDLQWLWNLLRYIPQFGVPFCIAIFAANRYRRWKQRRDLRQQQMNNSGVVVDGDPFTIPLSQQPPPEYGPPSYTAATSGDSYPRQQQYPSAFAATTTFQSAYPSQFSSPTTTSPISKSAYPKQQYGFDQPPPAFSNQTYPPPPTF